MITLIEEEQLDYCDVLLHPRYSQINSRNDVCLTKRYMTTENKLIANGIPVMNANMLTVGNFSVAKAMLADKMFATIHKHYKIEEIVEFLESLTENERQRVFISVGLREDFIDYDKLMTLRNYLENEGIFPGHVCLDVPNGYIDNFIKLVKKVKASCKETLVMAGNVCSADGVRILAEAGASIIKCGIGPGLACRTRFVTGVGRPQFSTIVECSEIAKQYNCAICADGGISYPGDAAKAFAAGAEFVMLGGYYAGTDEADGKFIKDSNGNKSKIFFGMASETAQKKLYGGIKNYKTSEGALLQVKYQGSVHDQNLKIMGGLRSACSYCGAYNLSELRDVATFYKVRRQHTANGESHEY